MKPYIKRSQKDYSLSFKSSVVSQIERGELTFTQATKQYGIQCHSTVKNWFDRYSTVLLDSIPSHSCSKWDYVLHD